MALSDIFNAKAIREENDYLKAQLNQMYSLLSPQLRDVNNQINYLNQVNGQIAAAHAALQSYNNSINQQMQEIAKVDTAIKEKQKYLVDMDEQMMLEEVGMYRPSYEFATSSHYADALKEVREEQKQMIKSNIAAVGGELWTVNGSASQGKKMTGDMKKLLLRAFNSECDEAVAKVKYNTYDAAEKRIRLSFDTICKLGTVMQVSLTKSYLKLKIKELKLALDYRMKKQQEKEEQVALRAQMREEAKLQKEIEEARKKSEKEQKHYLNAMEKLNKQLADADPSDIPALMQKKEEVVARLAEIDTALKNIDYREANIKAGYVYVISNIGAFGEGVYKIGMTRRLDPMERIDELGDASVPFDFDVHAMIFSDNAPKLEAALHKAFEDRKVNMINTRREFFRVSLEEIKRVIAENYDRTVEFIDVPDAEQYRMSENVRANMRK